MRRGFAAVVGLVLMSTAVPALATADAGQTWPSFNESDGCQQPAGFHGPLASRTGPLSVAEPIYGPYGDAFGRTIGEIDLNDTAWTFPTAVTGGRTITIRVHQRALPAFQRAAANLIAGASANPDQPYGVNRNQTFGMYARTIGGRFSISMHAFGTAVDINSVTNPYSADNVLITDMPAWFVQAWRDAGFCWGGDWQDIKDPMHFSWKGPAATPGYGQWPANFPVDSTEAGFPAAAWFETPWNLDHTADFVLSEANRDGATDAYRLRPWGAGTLIEFARSSADMNQCAVGRYWSPAPYDSESLLLADWDGDARNDLWHLDQSGSTVTIRVWTRADDYELTSLIPTGIPTSPGMKFTTGDVDRDGYVDLVVLRPGSSTTVDVRSGASSFSSSLLSAATPVSTDSTTWWPTMGDRDLDGLPDLAILTGSGTSPILHIAPRSAGYGTVTESRAIATPVPVLTAQLGSLDGDGRTDLFLMGTDGSVTGHLGGTLPGVSDVTRWFRDPNWTCPDDESIDIFDEIEAHLPRHGGANRFETSALLSRRFVKAPVEEVFIASGRNFPDALTAGPLAAVLGAPVLLVEPTSLPPPIAAELSRLAPDRVTIVGGPAAVSDAVVNAITAFTGAAVERVAGDDRYATAAELAKRFVQPETVYVATGRDFPDALSATPVASSEGAPILLVTRDAIPTSTLHVLRELAPNRIRVLGGTAAISESVVAELRTLASDTARIAGPNRFATAARLAGSLPQSAAAMVVYGRNYADAVSAGAIAASRGWPMLLVDERQATTPTAATLMSRAVTTIHVIGGPAAVSNTVWGELIEYVRSE